VKNFVKTWREYQGEDIIKSVTYQQGRQIIDKIRYEGIPHKIENNGIAIVLGNGTTRSNLTVENYYLNNGGLRNKYKAHVYGCNAVFREGPVHHLVVNNYHLLQEALTNKFFNTAKIYTHHSFWLKANDPEHVNLVPQKMISDAGTMALYLSCFHGNKTVYLAGFDADVMPNQNIYSGTDQYPADGVIDSNKIVRAQYDIMNIYKDVEFFRVVKRLGLSNQSIWSSLKNFNEVTFDQFTEVADIGLITYEHGYQQTRGPRKY
jgi:hypothetical protein